MNTMPKPGDKKAAFIGLAAGSLVVFAVLYAVVQWTNTQFEGKSHGAPAAAGQPAQQH